MSALHKSPKFRVRRVDSGYWQLFDGDRLAAEIVREGPYRWRSELLSCTGRETGYGFIRHTKADALDVIKETVARWYKPPLSTTEDGQQP